MYSSFPLLDLPNEILLLISENLPDFLSERNLKQTSRVLHDVIPYSPELLLKTLITLKPAQSVLFVAFLRKLPSYPSLEQTKSLDNDVKAFNPKEVIFALLYMLSTNNIYNAPTQFIIKALSSDNCLSEFFEYDEIQNMLTNALLTDALINFSKNPSSENRSDVEQHKKNRNVKSKKCLINFSGTEIEQVGSDFIMDFREANFYGAKFPRDLEKFNLAGANFFDITPGYKSFSEQLDFLESKLSLISKTAKKQMLGYIVDNILSLTSILKHKDEESAKKLLETAVNHSIFVEKRKSLINYSLFSNVKKISAHTKLLSELKLFDKKLSSKNSPQP